MDISSDALVPVMDVIQSSQMSLQNRSIDKGHPRLSVTRYSFDNGDPGEITKYKLETPMHRYIS
jgi:hypothetical protein